MNIAAVTQLLQATALWPKARPLLPEFTPEQRQAQGVTDVRGIMEINPDYQPDWIRVYAQISIHRHEGILNWLITTDLSLEMAEVRAVVSTSSPQLPYQIILKELGHFETHDLADLMTSLEGLAYNVVADLRRTIVRGQLPALYESRHRVPSFLICPGVSPGMMS